jgi:hypothetical protein
MQERPNPACTDAGDSYRFLSIIYTPAFFWLDGFVMNLKLEDRQKLENILRETLPFNEDGSISLIARAWAVKGTV